MLIDMMPSVLSVPVPLFAASCYLRLSVLSVLTTFEDAHVSAGFLLSSFHGSTSIFMSYKSRSYGIWPMIQRKRSVMSVSIGPLSTDR